MLQLLEVSKRYDSPDGGPVREVLRGVRLDVRRGESLAIVGPSGSGKSTLLNIIGALDRPTTGRVLLDGEDLAAMSPDQQARVRNRDVGFVFQLHHLLPQCTALENVLVPTLAFRGGGGKDEHTERARALLARVGLADRARHRPGQLSGGECQRVAVVRALINQPKLLLADEPTGSLDAAAAERLGTLLGELNRESDVTLVTVTHSAYLAEQMQRRLELRDGALVATGAVS